MVSSDSDSPNQSPPPADEPVSPGSLVGGGEGIGRGDVLVEDFFFFIG